MPFRVQEVLLVSSEYDAFVLEEDGPITERLFSSYSELNLSSAPRITHVRTAADARTVLASRRFDLVMTVVRVEDGDAAQIADTVHELRPGVPVVLLTFDEADLAHFRESKVPNSIERAFLWSGDANTLIAAIKIVEDAKNVDPDTRNAGVQVILVVEDSVRAYSSFLAGLYPALFRQSQSLIADGGNPLHRILRMRARPRILLASDYETGWSLAMRYREHLLALITDLRFPRDGEECADAGAQLVEAVRAEAPGLPVLLLTAESDAAARAEALGVGFVAKSSSKMRGKLDGFLSLALGFGDFVFRTADGVEVDRARNVYEMEQALERAPAASISYHAGHHHFSTWLKARGMFDLAAQIRPRRLEEFDDAEAVRVYLVGVVRRARELEQEGTISDVAAPPVGSETRFVRIGSGSIGGKGRALAFVNSLIARLDLLERFDGLQVRIPKTVVLGADEFERFAPWDDVEEIVTEPDAQHVARALACPLSEEAREELRFAVDALKGPLAVRSSNVLEDSRFRPFAGVYKTYVIPNNAADPEVRFQQLQDAVRAVYASVFMRAARNYLAGTPHLVHEQRMAVVVQQVVGMNYGARFYPLLSGVAQSRNHYPLGGQRPEEGVAHIALGLGQQVVGGGAAIHFSPGAPEILPQLASARDLARSSQSRFFAVDLTRTDVDLVARPDAALIQLPLAAAREDSVLRHVASIYDSNDDVLRDSPRAQGVPVVSFANVLRYRAFPLADAIALLLSELRDAVGGEVEVELAVDGPGVLPDGTVRPPRLFVLQLRPLAPLRLRNATNGTEERPPGYLLLESDGALGDGLIEGVQDVVYVRRDDLEMADTRQAAGEVRAIVGVLDRPYVLIGPGRWGTSDPNLGIPILWRDIAGLAALVETPLEGRHVEPSQGSHFFRNMVSERVGYVSVAHEEAYDRAFLDSLPAETESELARHVRLGAPLYIAIDGREGRAVMLARS